MESLIKKVQREREREKGRKERRREEERREETGSGERKGKNPKNSSGKCTDLGSTAGKMAGLLSHRICFPKDSLMKGLFYFWFCLPLFISHS